MKPILNTVTMRWNVKGIGSFARKEDALAAIEANRMKNQIHFMVSDTMYEALMDAANERRTTMAELIRTAIEKEVGL